MLEETAKQMTWHKKGIRHKKDEEGNTMLAHPFDGAAWKAFDEIHKDDIRVIDPRNQRVAISMDGFNPFGMTTTQYSCWPLFFMPLNLPLESLCKKHIFPTLIILGPNYPGKNMNVYMQPLWDDLK